MNGLKAAPIDVLGRRSIPATIAWLFLITAIGSPAAAATYTVEPITVSGAIVGIDNGVVVGTTVPLQPPFTTYTSVPTGIAGSLVSGYAEYQGATTRYDLPVVWNRFTGVPSILDNGGTGRALATNGTQIVGESVPYDLGFGNAEATAALWSSPLGKVVYLDDPYAERMTLQYSQATGIWGGLAVGDKSVGAGPTTATLWRISGPTATSLAPNGLAYSNALGIARGQIVGDAYNVHVNQASILHAGVWTGLTASSFVDLSAPSETSSVAYATNGVQQVGYVSFDQSVNTNPPADHHAVVWNGTAASMQMLPLLKGFTDSIVYGIDQQGDIVGALGGPQLLGQLVEWVPNRLPGDADFDGKVDMSDLLIVARNYGKSGNLGFVDGDFNFDGSVGFDDLVILARNYGATAPTASELAQFDPSFRADVERAFAEVPEPMSAIPLFLLAAATIPRRQMCGRDY